MVGKTPEPHGGERFDESGEPVAYWAPLLGCPVRESETERTARPGEPVTPRPPRLEEDLSFAVRPTSPSVSLEAEVPEALFEGMREFLRTHPHWDQYSVITSALAGFLFQNGSDDTTVKDHYLAGFFPEP